MQSKKYKYKQRKNTFLVPENFFLLGVTSLISACGNAARLAEKKALEEAERRLNASPYKDGYADSPFAFLQDYGHESSVPHSALNPDDPAVKISDNKNIFLLPPNLDLIPIVAVNLADGHVTSTLSDARSADEFNVPLANADDTVTGVDSIEASIKLLSIRNPYGEILLNNVGGKRSSDLIMIGNSQKVDLNNFGAMIDLANTAYVETNRSFSSISIIWDIDQSIPDGEGLDNFRLNVALGTDLSYFSKAADGSTYDELNIPEYLPEILGLYRETVGFEVINGIKIGNILSATDKTDILTVYYINETPVSSGEPTNDVFVHFIHMESDVQASGKINLGDIQENKDTNTGIENIFTLKFTDLLWVDSDPIGVISVGDINSDGKTDFAMSVETNEEGEKDEDGNSSLLRKYIIIFGDDAIDNYETIDVTNWTELANRENAVVFSGRISMEDLTYTYRFGDINEDGFIDVMVRNRSYSADQPGAKYTTYSGKDIIRIDDQSFSIENEVLQKYEAPYDPPSEDLTNPWNLQQIDLA